MPLLLLVPLLLASPEPDQIFSCTIGTKRIEITGTPDTLTYRFGRPGKPEMTLTGSASGGVFYHTEMYARGEDQTLRFVNGAYSYVVFNRWQAPTNYGGKIDPVLDLSGLLILKDGRQVRRLDCSDGDMHEWPVFKTLPEDPENLTPDDLESK